jgi:hypothetical protein
MDVQVKVDPKAKTVTVTLPLISKVSDSGKSILIASTRGTAKTGVQYEGAEVDANVNISIPNPAYVKPPKA